MTTLAAMGCQQLHGRLERHGHILIGPRTNFTLVWLDGDASKRERTTYNPSSENDVFLGWCFLLFLDIDSGHFSCFFAGDTGGPEPILPYQTVRFRPQSGH